MDNMVEQINQILNDPESMKHIMDMAAAFGVNQTDGDPPKTLPLDVTNVLQQAQKKDEKQQALVQALLPYLRPTHQHRLERAIKVAKLSHLASMAIRSDGDLTVKEAPYDV